jgi:hypothetical protein
MRLSQTAILAAVLVIAGCGGFSESKLNPLNWFKRSAPEALEFVQAPVDGRSLIGQVTVLKVEPFPGGAIVRATGVPTSQGWWDAALVKVDPAEDAEPGVVTYEFRIFPPPEPRPAGTPYSRQVTVATSLTDIALESITKIVVVGETNALSSRR